MSAACLKPLVSRDVYTPNSCGIASHQRGTGCPGAPCAAPGVQIPAAAAAAAAGTRVLCVCVGVGGGVWFVCGWRASLLEILALMTHEALSKRVD